MRFVYATWRMPLGRLHPSLPVEPAGIWTPTVNS